MTTKITSKYEAPNHVTIGRTATWSGVYVGTAAMGERTGTAVDRAEFLAAISAELGVLIINRDDLPPVIESKTGTKWEAGELTWTYPSTCNLPTPDDLRERAYAYLALAERLAANPPLDEALVDVIASVIDGTDEPSGLTAEQIFRVARRLVRAGVRAPEEAGR